MSIIQHVNTSPLKITISMFLHLQISIKKINHIKFCTKFRYTHAYISQANEYHRRHFYQQQMHQHQMALQQQQQQNISLNSTMLLDEETTNNIYSAAGGNGRLSAAASISNLSQIGAASNYYNRGERGYYARSEYADSRCFCLSSTSS